MTPEVLRISRHPDAIRTHWPRIAAERLFSGQWPTAVLSMVPRLFSLCRGAQTLAARMALQQARGEDGGASPAELQVLVLEAARETLRKVLQDWSLVFDGEPADPYLMAQWRRAQTLEQCADLAREAVFGLSCADWLGLGEAAWLDWIRAGDLPPACWLSSLSLVQDGCAFLPELDASMLAAGLTHCLQKDGPVWQDLPREVGALAREQHSLPTLLARQHRAQARLLARLVQLARWLCGEDWPRASVASAAEGTLALVDTARGPLLHLLALNGNGSVKHYQVIPPTAWHVRQGGLIDTVLSSMSNASKQAQYRQLALIDPCVAFELD